MKSHFSSLFLLPALLIASSPLVTAAENESIAVVAQRELPGFLAKIPAGMEANYGFTDRAEFARAKVGRPMPVYTVPPVADEGAGGSDTSAEHPIPAGTWRVPVMVGPDVRALLTVEAQDGKMRVVDLGASSLAKEVDAFDKAHPGKHRGLLRLEKFRCDYMMLGDSGAALENGEYHPLRSARMVFSDDSSSHRTRKELFDHMRKRSREHRPADR